MRIIPAIDVIDGKCVRLSQGNYTTKKIYNESPLKMAKIFEDAGIKHLHLIDLDGAKYGEMKNWRVLEEIASKTNLKIDFGGGMHTTDSLEKAFNYGAEQVTGGSIALKDRELFLSWLKKYGAGRIILGADALNGKVAVDAWQTTTQQELNEFISSYVQEGIAYVVCTDISRDGMLKGPAIELYSNIVNTNQKVKLIASGGVTSMDDVYQLEKVGAEGVIIGKAFYENKITLKQIQDYVS